MSEQSPDQASSVDSANASNPSLHLTHIGPSLIAGREALGLSVDDVSNRLRLSPRQIHALESDDFIILPEAVISRGFIRNYARLLSIDPAPLLHIYNQYVPVQDNQAIAIPSANIVISGEANRPWRAYAWVAALVVLLLGGWIAYMDYFSKKLPAGTAAPSNHEVLMDIEPGSVSAAPAGDSAVTQPATSSSEQSAEMSSAQSAQPQAAQLPEAQLPTTSIAPATTAQLADATTPVVAAPVPVAAPAANTQPANTPPVNPGTASGAQASAQLKFTATEATWVSIYDASGQQIANKTISANSSDVITGKPPFKIVVGNIKGTTLEYNNKPVDLALYSKVNVARLTLE